MIRKVAIIGAGDYGEVLIQALATEEERARGVEVVATHRRGERREELAEKYGIPVLADNLEACTDADMIYPVVRPEQMAELMEQIGPSVGDDQIVATGAASLRLSLYRPYLPSKCTLAWVFPTPFIRIKAGFLAIHAEPGTDPDKIEDLKEYWSRFCEEVVVIGEEAMDSFVILHASSYPFLAPLVKALIEFGQENGFSPKLSRKIVLSTFRSTGRMMEEMGFTAEMLGQLAIEAAVPGSLSAAGLAVLEKSNAEGIFARMLIAARDQAERHRGG